MDKISRANSLLKEAAELLNPTTGGNETQGTPGTTSPASTTASTTAAASASTSSSSVISRSVNLWLHT